MPDIQAEIAAYDQMRAELETRHLGKWVLIHDRQLVSVCRTRFSGYLRSR